MGPDDGHLKYNKSHQGKDANSNNRISNLPYVIFDVWRSILNFLIPDFFADQQIKYYKSDACYNEVTSADIFNIKKVT